MKHFIEVKKLIYKYKLFREDREDFVERQALDGVSLSVKKGDFVGILGPNGSGKSTLARQLAALLLPREGTILIKGRSTADSGNYEEIRQTVTMVFQNPDNQIIGTTVEEDLAFGPENLACPPKEIASRIGKVLEITGLEAYRFKSTAALSGGQKQKTAIAGVLAMEPECIILDEPTAMIDPEGRREVLKAVWQLNRDKGITIIYISHDTEEVKCADYLFVMKEGQIRGEGRPYEVFDRDNLFDHPDQELPCFWRVKKQLQNQGLALPDSLHSEEDFFSWMSTESEETALVREVLKNQAGRKIENRDAVTLDTEGLLLDHVSYGYKSMGAEADQPAIQDVSLRIKQGEFLAIVGRSGSGKTTLLKHMNGLLRPDQGQVYFHGNQIWEKSFSRKKLRQKVAYCFQYPENQLFEETVFKDVCFGPRNMGLDDQTCSSRAADALEAVGIDQCLWQNSPLTLSGGQKRRIALAGVIAMEPDFLILDEPTAGLDWAGKDRIFRLLHRLNQEKGMTIILVSHNMDDAAAYADRLLVMAEGCIEIEGTPEEIFDKPDLLKRAGLDLPEKEKFLRRLMSSGPAGAREGKTENRPDGSDAKKAENRPGGRGIKKAENRHNEAGQKKTEMRGGGGLC